MPPADAAGAAALGVTAGAINTPSVKLPIDAPRSVLIDTINKLIEDANNRLEKSYPIGTIYINASVATDPRQLLGVGVWERYGKGRVLVSQDAAQTEFDVLGETGGAKTHFHWQTVGSDPGTLYIENDGSGSGQSRVISLSRSQYGGGSSSVNPSREDGTYESSSLQPYIVVYVWRRIG